MIKLILLSILLTVVYSWEEFKRAARVLLYGILRKQKPLTAFAGHIDEFVSLAVIFATVPAGLMYFLASSQNFFQNLLWLSVTLLSVSAVAAGAGTFARRLRYASLYSGADKIFPVAFSLGGFVSPVMSAFSNAAYLPRKTLAKFAAIMSIPPLAGLALKRANGATDPMLIPNIDALIVVLVGALFIQIISGALKDFLGSYRFRKLSAYFRIVLGIALTGLIFGPGLL